MGADHHTRARDGHGGKEKLKGRSPAFHCPALSLTLRRRRRPAGGGVGLSVNCVGAVSRGPPIVQLFSFSFFPFSWGPVKCTRPLSFRREKEREKIPFRLEKPLERVRERETKGKRATTFYLSLRVPDDDDEDEDGPRV